MFRKLLGRRVVVSCSGPESFRGTVARVGILHLELRDFEVITSAAPAAPAAGTARIPRRLITWIQEL